MSRGQLRARSTAGRMSVPDYPIPPFELESWCTTWGIIDKTLDKLRKHDLTCPISLASLSDEDCSKVATTIGQLAMLTRTVTQSEGPTDGRGGPAGE